MATAEDGSFKPVIRASRLALTSKAAMAGYIYACEYCEMRFQSMKYLKEHQSKCRAELVKDDGSTEVFTCDFCRREFTCGAFAKSHMRYCDRSIQMQKAECCYCKNEFTLEELATHKSNCFARKENITYTCSYCGFKSENAVDAKAHNEKCRALKALAYAPKQVLHKCKACAKLFQGKENFIRHAASCSLSKTVKRKAVVANAPPAKVSNESTDPPRVISPNRKRPHSIKKNPDGSMVIVLCEREGSKSQVGEVGEIVKKARLASPEKLGKGSLIIDLRGMKTLVTDDENEESNENNNGNIESGNQGTQPSPRSTGGVASDKPYRCPYCKILFENKHIVARHMKTCFLGKQRYSLKCTYCTTNFADLQARTAHQKLCPHNMKVNVQAQKQKDSPSDVWNEPLTVTELSPEKSGPPESRPLQHSIAPVSAPVPAAEKIYPPASAPEKNASPVVVKTIENPFVCEYCKVPYENLHLLNRHMKSCYLGKQRYSLKCSFCTLEFAELRSRMNHEKSCAARIKVRKSAVAPDTAPGDLVSAPEAGDSNTPRPEVERANLPAVIDSGIGVHEDGARNDEQPPSSSMQSDDSTMMPDHNEPEEEMADEPSETEIPQSAMLVRFPLQKYKCDICGMDGFQQEASLWTHRNFCSWVSQQKVKIMPEKKMGTGLSISARTSDALFNEAIDEKDKYAADQSLVKKASGSGESAETTEVSYHGHDDSLDSSVDDNLSDDEDGDAGAGRMMYVDGTVDSDDDSKQTVRHRRSSKKSDMMPVSPKSVGSHGSRGDSVERVKSKSGISGKNVDNNEEGRNAAKSEIECQCGEKFGNKDAHKAHLRNCQSSKGTAKIKRVKCKNCKKRVKDSSIASHLKVCQRTCLKCKRQFGNIGAVIIHQRSCAGKGKNNTKKISKDGSRSKAETVNSAPPKTKKASEQKTSAKKSVPSEQRDSLKCPKCATIFGNIGALGRHRLTCQGIRMAKSTKTNEKASRTCIHCKSVFQSKKSAVRHQKNCKRNVNATKATAKSSQGKKSFLCGKCKRYFGNAGALAFHKYSCRGKVEASKTVFQGSAGSVVCPKCNKRFGNVGALGAHKRFCIVPKKGQKKATKMGEANQSVGNFKCEYCKKTYSSLQALAGHIGFCKYNNVARPKEMPYSCQKCKQGFLNTQSLAVHVKHQMCGKPQGAAPKSTPKSPNKENKCSKCLRTFGSPGALGFHFKTCQGKKPVKFKCKYCSKVSKDAKTYAAHVKVCKVKKGSSMIVTCKFCKSRFPNMQSLGGHIRFCSSREKFPNASKDSGDPVLKFSCKLCGMKTKTMGGLTYHMVYFCKKRKGGKVIKGTKQSVVKPNAKKTAIQQSPSKGEVPCQYCGKIFGNTGGLGSHLRYCRMRDGQAAKSPSGGKVSFVKNASKEFKNDVHVVYVFICPQCGVKFDNKAQLLEHFLACLNSNPEEMENDKQSAEPQPGTSGVELPKKKGNDEKEVEAKSQTAVKPEKKDTVKGKTNNTSLKSPASKLLIYNEPCKDCDWAALSATDNDIKCHKKHCLNNKHSVAAMPKTADTSGPLAKCEICGMEFKSKDGLNVHFKFCKWVKDHKIIANLPEPSTPEGNSDTADENETAENTDDQVSKFKAKNVLVPNFVSETDSNDSVVYKCEYCGRTSNNKGAVINHVRYCVHRPQQLVSSNKEPRTPSGTTVIDLSHLSAPKL